MKDLVDIFEDETQELNHREFDITEQDRQEQIYDEFDGYQVKEY